MIRIFLSPEKLFSKNIIITGEQARHLSLVMRVKPDDSLIIFDGLGNKYTCKILQSRKKEVIAEQIKKETCSVESPLLITLARGLPKGDKMDFIVQKSTELGVRKIIPLVTERSQIRHTGKTDRWRKIATSASQQSGRERTPEIEEPVDFKEFLDRKTLQTPLCPPSVRWELERGESNSHKGIIFSEEEKEKNLKQILSGFKNIQGITLLIGPEGGFSQNEAASAAEKGFIEASLGPRILRTETAAITGISIIQYELGDIG